MKPSSRAWLAFLGGLAVGATLGVLFAPDSGKNTREKLSFKLDQYLNKLRELLGQATETPDEAQRKRSELSNSDKRRAEELLHEVESLLDDLKAKPVDQ